MKPFLNKITLSQNARGCYILDTVKGCKHNCYNDCYAKRIAVRYGRDFASIKNREFHKDTRQLFLFDFYDTRHEDKIIKDIKKIDMPFVRIGEMGDCSEAWEHTLSVCKVISRAKKKIVIVTKHWVEMPEHLLKDLTRLDITINTSISALDSPFEVDYRLFQYYRLKQCCNSILRVVTCNFNKNNPEGLRMSRVQSELLKNKNVINTVFRPSKNNTLVTDGVISVTRRKFLKSFVLASFQNENTYFGTCKSCPDMCGIK